MNVIRTLIIVVLSVVLAVFIVMNLQKASVNFWPLEQNYLHFEWPVGIIAIVFFLLGFVPLWLYHRADHWRLTRRIGALENSMRIAAGQPPIATSTQLEAASEESAST